LVDRELDVPLLMAPVRSLFRSKVAILALLPASDTDCTAVSAYEAPRLTM
jgi:hypothetical protein